MPFSHMSAARAAKWGAYALTALYLGWAATPVLAQKSGGTLRLFHRDSPASGSIHEEATISVVMSVLGGIQWDTRHRSGAERRA